MDGWMDGWMDGFLFPLSALGQHKKAEEKSQILHNFTQNYKNRLDNIIGTLLKLWVNNFISSM